MRHILPLGVSLFLLMSTALGLASYQLKTELAR